MTKPANLFATYTGHIAAALDRLEVAGSLPGGLNRANITCEPPRDPAPLEPRRQRAFGYQLIEHAIEQRGILGVQRHRQRL